MTGCGAAGRGDPETGRQTHAKRVEERYGVNSDDLAPTADSRRRQLTGESTSSAALAAGSVTA
jgi:hypothetical protein